MSRIDWTVIDPLLSSLTTGEVAERFGVSRKAAYSRRVALGLPEVRPRHRARDRVDAAIALVTEDLGKVPDKTLARRIGVHVDTIWQRRNELGILACSPRDGHAPRGCPAKTLRSLSPKLRAVVRLVDVEGLSYSAAAAALGIPDGTLMSRLHRGRVAAGTIGDGTSSASRR